MQLVIIRGLPGAGKSTYAKTNFPRHMHYEADMYFSRNGSYVFNPSELNAAHRWCQSNAFQALKKGKDVVVTNTFIQEWEFDTYFEMASELDCPVLVVELRTQFQNIHGVPEDKLDSMKKRWCDWEDIIAEFMHLDHQYEVVS